jgi:hypothetical protein
MALQMPYCLSIIEDTQITQKGGNEMNKVWDLEQKTAELVRKVEQLDVIDQYGLLDIFMHDQFENCICDVEECSVLRDWEDMGSDIKILLDEREDTIQSLENEIALLKTERNGCVNVINRARKRMLLPNPDIDTIQRRMSVELTRLEVGVRRTEDTGCCDTDRLIQNIENK